jgi:heterodisulfide reductase subunit A-like polyferredoxin
MLVEVFQLRVPDFFIVDAVVGMEGNGPTSPDLRNIGLVLASNNAVAMDAVIATMMGLDAGRLRFLQKAKATGLGDFSMESIEIVGELKRLLNFKIPPLGGEASIDNEEIQEFLSERTRLRPQVNPDLCTSCETCVDQCPVGALTMQADLPVVNPKICITCFCCQEICPLKAITLV